MKYWFIVNPVAGKGEFAKKVCVTIRDYAKEKDLDFKICLTKCKGDATRIARDICEKYPEEKVYLAGDGSLPTAKSIPAAILPPMGSEAVGGAALCACARRALAEGRTVTDAALAPVYLRVPQAERERLEREAKKQDS